MSTKIIIIDDHKVVRDGIKLFLENDPSLEVVMESGDGRDVLNLIKDNKVDLVLMDISMEKQDGIQTTKEINQHFPEIKIIALTMHNDYQHIKAMMEAGASGYLLKNCDENELKEAIKSVMDEQIYYSREVATAVMNNMARKTKRKNDNHFITPLTPREKEVYKLILQEMSNQDIADKLFISVRTVEVHKRNLMEKTGAKNSTGLVLYAVKNQLFDEFH